MHRYYRKSIIIVFIAVSVLAAYWQVGGFDFVNFDDPVYITTNKDIRHGLTFDGLKFAFTYVYASNWHPLTWISHMLDIEMFGLNPGMHHLTNVFLHILNSILLFLVFERMTGALLRSAVVAALFALHPIHVESVAWISERKDVLSTFFWMLTMLAYHWYVMNKTISRYLLVALLFGLGLMAKPMLVTLPFVLLLLDFWPLRRNELAFRLASTDSRHEQNLWPDINLPGALLLILEKTPLIVMAIIAGSETFYAQWVGGAVNSLGQVHIAMRVQNAITSYVAYLWKMIWPMHLAVFYPYPWHFNTVVVAACLIFLTMVTLTVLIVGKRMPYLATGWLWYLGTLVPVIGIIKVGSQSMADRYTYIPFIGIFVMVVWGLRDIFYRWSYGKAALGSLALIILALLTWATSIQVATWKNSEILFSHALAVTGDNYLAHDNLGVALFDRGDVDGAIKHYRESIRLRRNYVNAQCNLGVALAKKKQYAEAFAHYRECLRIKPGYSEAYYNMGVALADLGRKDEAVKQYTEVMKNYPRHENAHRNLGLLLAEKGNFDEAIEHYYKALDADPDNVGTRINLADSLLKQGNIEEALIQVEDALKIDPKNLNLCMKLTEIQLKRHNDLGAISAYQKALRIYPKTIKALYGNAAVYVYDKDNRPEKAIDQYRKIREIRPHDPYWDYKIACLYSHQGNTEEAIYFLKMAIDKGMTH
jgi:tetratricopeptide (TPR) repeat protein